MIVEVLEMNKLVRLLLVLFIGVISYFIFVANSHAQTPTAAASCATPSQVQNVRIDYPGCVGTQCNFTQATCSWAASTGAAKYQLTVTQVESGEVVKNEQVETSITNVTFAVTQNRTYKCDVAAINSCGTTGVAGTFSLFCKVDALIASPVPTTPPQPTAVPTIPPAGALSNSIVVAVAAILLFVVGAFLVVL